jgi:hypothetical protein
MRARARHPENETRTLRSRRTDLLLEAVDATPQVRHLVQHLHPVLQLPELGSERPQRFRGGVDLGPLELVPLDGQHLGPQRLVALAPERRRHLLDFRFERGRRRRRRRSHRRPATTSPVASGSTTVIHVAAHVVVVVLVHAAVLQGRRRRQQRRKKKSCVG